MSSVPFRPMFRQIEMFESNNNQVTTATRHDMRSIRIECQINAIVMTALLVHGPAIKRDRQRWWYDHTHSANPLRLALAIIVPTVLNKTKQRHC